MNKLVRNIALPAAGVALVAGIAYAAAPSPHASAQTSSSSAYSLGWYPAESGSFSTSEYSGLGMTPSYVTYYNCVPGATYADPLQTTLVQDAHSAGVETFLKMDDDCGGSGGLPDVANGSDNTYLQNFGKDIAATGDKMMITYDWEMNGSWNDYGPGGSEGVTPQEYIEAWNNVVENVSKYDNGLVTWVWDPNIASGAASASPYWSSGGDTVQDVGMIGVDAYLCLNQTTGTCAQSYDSNLKSGVDAIKALDTSVPTFLAETGIGGTDRNSQLTALVQQTQADGLAGIMYFNQDAEALTTSEQASLGAAAKAAATPPASAPGYITNGLKVNVAPGPSLVLDNGGNLGSGTTVQLAWESTGTKADEQWVVTPIAGTSDFTINFAGNTGYCLDDEHSGTAAGNQVWLYQCNGTNAQEWAPGPASGEVEAVYATAQDGKPMVLDWQNTSTGTETVIEPATDSLTQQWSIP